MLVHERAVLDAGGSFILPEKTIWVAPQDLDSCPMEQKLFPGQEFFYFLKKALWNKSLPRRDARIEIRFLSLCGIETDRKRPSVKERRKYYGQQ